MVLEKRKKERENGSSASWEKAKDMFSTKASFGLSSLVQFRMFFSRATRYFVNGLALISHAFSS